MGRGAVLSLRITGDARDGIRALDQTEGRTAKFGAGLGKIAGLVGGAFAVGAVADFGKEAFDAASNLEQMVGSVGAVFGDSQAKILQLSEQAHNTVGLASADYDQMAAVIGSQLKNAGVPMDQLADKTANLIQKGADMSAVFGGSAADAVDALSSVMKGEFDPIEKYGVSLNQTTINAALAAKGQKNLTGAALKQAQVAAALDIVTKQTAETHGQFAAQSDTAAEKSQKLAAWFTDLKATIGSYLLPVFVALSTFVETKVAPVIEKLTSDTGPLGNIFGAVADFLSAQLVPALSSLWQWISAKVLPAWESIAKSIVKVAVPAFQAVWAFIKNYAVPILKSVLGPVIAGVRSFWDHLSAAIEKNKGKFEAIYEKLKPFLDFVKNKLAPFIGGALKFAFEALSKAIGPVVDTITWILDKAGAVIGFFGKVGNFLFGGGSSSGGGGGSRGAARGAIFGASAGGGGRLFGAAGSLGGGGAGPSVAAAGLPAATVINITVQGAVDPMSTARQIQQLLDRYATRTGARIAVAR